MEVWNIRARISDNISRFKENIDYIDLKQRLCEIKTLKNAIENKDLAQLLISLGYAKQSITQAEHIYLLSEGGYAKLIKIMDSDLAWEEVKINGEYSGRFNRPIIISAIKRKIVTFKVHGSRYDARYLYNRKSIFARHL